MPYRIFCTCGMKPMSAMRSASSTTSTSTCRDGELAALDEVDEPARGADDDVDALLQRGDLRVHATRRRRRPGPCGRATSPSGPERSRDLGGELTGGHEDQAAGAAGLRLADAPRSGRPKARVLPEPVLALPQHVAPGEGVGDGERLDGKRFGRCPGARGPRRGRRGGRGPRRLRSWGSCSLSSCLYAWGSGTPARTCLRWRWVEPRGFPAPACPAIRPTATCQAMSLDPRAWKVARRTHPTRIRRP